MIVSEIKLYELLKAKIGEKEAEAFVQILEQRVDSKFDDRKNEFVLEKDKEKLLTKADALAIFATKQDLAQLEGKLETKIADTKAELIKWMFIFWIGTIGVLSGILFTMLRTYLK
jgi:hypothetical protein